MIQLSYVAIKLPEDGGALGVTASGQWARQLGAKIVVWDEAMHCAVHFLPLLRVPLREVKCAVNAAISSGQTSSMLPLLAIVQTALRSRSELWTGAALLWVEEDELLRPEAELAWAADNAPTQRLRHLARRYCKPRA